VDWLDREIARESGQPAPAAVPPSVAAVVPPGPVPTTQDVVSTAQAAVDAEAILARYRSEPEALQKSVKLGCYLYFFLALVILGLGLAGWYFLRMAHT